MKHSMERKILQDINGVLKKYSEQNYDPDVVMNVLLSSLSRKPGTRKEYFNLDIEPYEILKEQRTRMLYSLTKLALLTGIPKSNLSAMENGKRPIGVKMAKVLANALGINYKVLL